MKKITLKILPVLFAVAMLVVALPFSALAEDIGYMNDSSHQHHYAVDDYVTFVFVSEEEHIKMTRSIYTCITCGEVMYDDVFDYESHDNLNGRIKEEYESIDEEKHNKIWYTYGTCKWCGMYNSSKTDELEEDHTKEWCYNTIYDRFSNEQHCAIQCHDLICLWCGDLFDRNIIDSWYDWHEFDDSVDPEVDMDGVCILCGDAVSW